MYVLKLTMENAMSMDICMIDAMLIRLNRIRDNYVTLEKTGNYPFLSKSIMDMDERIRRHEAMKAEIETDQTSKNKKPA